jgi:hypothetical protein
MVRRLAVCLRATFVWLLPVLLAAGLLTAGQLVFPRQAPAGAGETVIGSDGFSRANGGLRANSDGDLGWRVVDCLAAGGRAGRAEHRGYPDGGELPV